MGRLKATSKTRKIVFLFDQTGAVAMGGKKSRRLKLSKRLKARYFMTKDGCVERRRTLTDEH